MAGSYPDAPGQRMAYDRDGTVVTGVVGGTNAVETVALGSLQAGNNENGNANYLCNLATDANNQYVSFAFLFPQNRDIIGYHMACGFNATGSVVETSTNTTNGFDGTWVTVQTPIAPFSRDETIPQIRSNGYTALAISGVKNLRFRTIQPNNGTAGVATMHLFGSISASDTSDRLVFWHPTLNQALDATPAYLDWGDVPQTNVATRSFRIYNNAATRTANSVTIGCEALTDTTPTNVGTMTFSTDNITFSSTVTIASIAAQTLSGVIYIKKTTPANAVLSVWWERVTATAASFT